MYTITYYNNYSIFIYLECNNLSMNMYCVYGVTGELAGQVKAELLV